MNPLWISLIAAAITIAGGLLIVCCFEWVKRNGDQITALAAGVLVSLSLIEILPEAFSHATHAGLWCASGFLLMYFLEHFSGSSHCAGDECPERDISLIAYIGLFLHSLLDGAALFASYQISAELSLLMGIGVLLHEFPEGLASGALLLHRGLSRKKVFLLTALVGLATPLGTLCAQLFFPEMQPGWSYPVLAAIAGSFLYTSVAGLLTHSHRKKDWSIISFFLLGFSFFVVYGLLADGHAH